MSAAPASASSYDPQRSRVSDDRMADFLRSPVDPDLLSVPGIGPRAVELLKSNANQMFAVHTTHQLIGLFLTLRDRAEMTTREHCDAFWAWLQAKGINAYRSGIVMVIAEKANTFMPGMYDASEFAQ